MSTDRTTPTDSETSEPRQILGPDGRAVGAIPELPDETLVRLCELMVRSRDFDRRALAAQRAGRIGTYPMIEGHEAVQVGPVLALGAHDYVYPNYRQHGVQIAHGMPLDVILSYWRGLPTRHWDVHQHRMSTIAVPIGSHLPHAVGHAYSARLRGEDVVTMAYFGDGATSENDFHSGMNFAGVWKTPTVFICENNLYAISTPLHLQTAAPTLAAKAAAYGMHGVRVDGMDALAMYEATREAVERARAGGGPTLIEAICYRYGAHATADDARLYRSEDEESEWRPRDPIARMQAFLANKGLWSDEREAEILADAGQAFDTALEALEQTPLPDRASIVRHAYERIPSMMVRQLHDLERYAGEPASTFEDDAVWPVGDDPKPDGPTEKWTMAQAINAALHQAMERDDSTVVLGQDVGLAGGVFRITEGLQKKHGTDRVIDTPLNESGILGTAIGMAMSGSRPIAEIQFDGFVYPGFDQIVSHMGRMRFRSRGHATLPMVVRWPNGAGIGAHEMHCDSPEAFFAHAPGHTVVVPSTPFDAKGLLAAAIESNDPVLFLEPKVLYRAPREEVPTEHYVIPLGSARIRRSGNDLTLVTYGGMVNRSLEAAERLSGTTSVEVIDLRTIYPWDQETVIESVERTGRMLFVQEPQRTAGIGAEVAAEISERCGYSLLTPVRRLAATDAPWPQFAIEKHALLSVDQIAAAIDDMVRG